MKQQATSNKQHHLSISFIFFLFLIFTSFAQHQEEYELSCGTEVNPDDLVYDVSYGNNQKLLDIILEENIAVPEGYYEYLGIENPVERYRAAAEPGKKYVPIKLWVYRNNDGTGNINTTQAYQIIDELNNIYSNNTNLFFYLLCDISFINKPVVHYDLIKKSCSFY